MNRPTCNVLPCAGALIAALDRVVCGNAGGRKWPRFSILAASQIVGEGNTGVFNATVLGDNPIGYHCGGSRGEPSRRRTVRGTTTTNCNDQRAHQRQRGITLVASNAFGAARAPGGRH